MASTKSSAPFGFGGEAFLVHHPPDYPTERVRLGLLLVLAVVGWTVVIPFIVAKLVLHLNEKNLSSENHGSANAGSNQNKKREKQQPSSAPPPADKDDGASLLGLVTAVCSILCFLNVVYLVLMSSNNAYAARAVLQAPLLTQEECQHILDLSYEAAERNYVKADNSTPQLLVEPVGWQKSRHTLYQTTDLNLVTDPFTREAREYMGHKLDARLAPLLERVFGVTPRAIRANDMFVVRYDAEERPSLAQHTDDSDISFNVLLSNDFEGGGTQFWDRLRNQPFANVQPAQVGQVLVHSALIHHEGMPVTKGVRHILVGFLAVDHLEPLTAEPTGLSWFASWFSLPFLHVKAKDGYTASFTRKRTASKEHKWTDNKYILSLFRDVVYFFEWVGDRLAPHFHASMVKEEDENDYLAALDETFEAKTADAPSATWFRGQQLYRDVGGTVALEWKTRRQSKDAFRDL